MITAGPADLGIISQVIADAFYDLPQSRWLVSDGPARREIFPGYFRLLVERMMDSGVVQTTPDRDAVALWLPTGGEQSGPPAGHAGRLAAVTGPWIGRFEAFDAELERHHPAGTPHHHLAILAVRPDRQGRGIGSKLLRAYHQVLDHARTPAYLEAAEPRSCRLYQRHGYVLRPGAPFRLPDDGPSMWPMVREPGAVPVIS